MTDMGDIGDEANMTFKKVLERFIPCGSLDLVGQQV